MENSSGRFQVTSDTRVSLVKVTLQASVRGKQFRQVPVLLSAASGEKGSVGSSSQFRFISGAAVERAQHGAALKAQAHLAELRNPILSEGGRQMLRRKAPFN